ncbi:MAG: hypothetical protein RLZZ383_693, partial [Pseudomonadota bacterium]
MNGNGWRAREALGTGATTLRDRVGMILLGWIAVTLVVGGITTAAAMPGLLVLGQSAIAGVVVLVLLVPPALAVVVPPMTMAMARGWLAAHDRNAGWTAWIRPPGGLFLAWGQGSLLLGLNLLLALPQILVSQGLSAATAGGPGESAASTIGLLFSLGWNLLVTGRFLFVPWLVIDRGEGVVTAFGTAWTATGAALGGYLRVAMALLAIRLGGAAAGAVLGAIAFGVTLGAAGAALPDVASLQGLADGGDPVV